VTTDAAEAEDETAIGTTTETDNYAYPFVTLATNLAM
jgi:hypothetical protein